MRADCPVCDRPVVAITRTDAGVYCSRCDSELTADDMLTDPENMTAFERDLLNAWVEEE